MHITGAVAFGLLAGCMHHGSMTGGSSASPSAGGGGEAGWVSLIDPSLSQWRDYDHDGPSPGWRVVGDTLMKSGSAGDLMSRQQYANFELDFDWKIGKGGNSGVFYRATTEYNHIYWSGPEYQLLDDPNYPDGKDPKTSAGSAYALYGVPRGVVKPYDTWNSSRIIVNGGHVEHWLNGVKVVEYELWSPDWRAHVDASKFKAWPDYGMAKQGHIGIQGDHPGALEIRNMRIMELK